MMKKEDKFTKAYIEMLSKKSLVKEEKCPVCGEDEENCTCKCGPADDAACKDNECKCGRPDGTVVKEDDDEYVEWMLVYDVEFDFDDEDDEEEIPTLPSVFLCQLKYMDLDEASTAELDDKIDVCIDAITNASGWLISGSGKKSFISDSEAKEIIAANSDKAADDPTKIGIVYADGTSNLQ